MQTAEQKRPKNMTAEELEAIPIIKGFKDVMDQFGGPGVRGDDIVGFTAKDGKFYNLHLGKNGWYRN